MRAQIPLERSEARADVVVRVRERSRACVVSEDVHSAPASLDSSDLTLRMRATSGEVMTQRRLRRADGMQQPPRRELVAEVSGGRRPAAQRLSRETR
jgi:hypothetical protein